MERLKRHNKQIVAIMSALVVLFGGVLSTSFNVSATDTYETSAVYYVNYARPSVSDTSGYVNILLSDGTMNTYFWNVMGMTEDGDYIPMKVSIILDSNKITFSPYGNLNFAYSFHLNIYNINKYGLFFNIHSADNSGSNKNTVHTRSFVSTVVGYQVYGNGIVQDNVGCTRRFEVHYAEDGSAELLMKVVNLLGTNNIANNEIMDTLHGILSSAESVENQLFSVIEYLKSVDSELDIISSILEDIYVRADELLEEQKKTNNWLEKIWNSIQEFFNPSDKEKTDSEQFDSETTEKSDEIGGLLEESKTEKPDVGDMSNSIDSNLDMTSANEYGAVLLNITENEYILQMIVIVVTVAIIAYVLFGKR